MPAWNLPTWAMNLSGVTGIGAALAGGAALALHFRRQASALPLPLPLPPLAAALAEAALWHTAVTGAAIALASNRHFQAAGVDLPGKDYQRGHIGWLCWLLLAPYNLGVQTAFWLYQWTSSGEPLHSRLSAWLYLGGWPASPAGLPPGQVALLDVTNELNIPAKVTKAAAAYRCFPSWETHGLAPDQLQAAVEWALEQRQQGRTILVFCTHGHGRSAAAAAALLLAAGEASTASQALELVKERRPGASPNHRQVAVLHDWAAKHQR